MPHLDAPQTAAALPFAPLLEALRVACLEFAAGQITCPERQVLPMRGGTMLSMPVVGQDLAAHKLVNVCVGNKALGLPTIQGQVTAYDSGTGTPLLTLDAPTVTARRTAAISMLGIRALHGEAREVVLIGTGAQAQGHAEALAAIFPHAKVWVKGSSLARAEAFCAKFGGNLSPTDQIPAGADVVIATTSSKTPVYDLAAQPGRLLVAVGAYNAQMAEIAPATVRASRLYVDDLAGARHEAGDLIQAGVDWNDVHSLAEALVQAPDPQQATLFKTVGCAAWDLAACRVALGR